MEMKRRICPPDGRCFVKPVSDVMNYTCVEDIQDLILTDIMKFTGALEDGDQKLGYMYFIICLGDVSQSCYMAHHEWLSYIH